ncbi:N-acetyltransferase, putative [Leishmania panamensis]|uniref:N-acetyltransferase, putative n=1 Tax=Leishmania panamensis TaxID=5679 RepID=A0A088RQE7_LEIPA|nr:N-acetyltransferase, putative [Leishmania panamensis]AIN98337.1 N-acetyltransferase, putative [Leishmania panamensis]
MPPKNVKRNQRSSKQRDNFDEATIDALVKAIEGKTKKGTTKSQLKQKEDKSLKCVNGENYVLSEQMRDALLAQMHQSAAQEDQYVNVPVPLTEEEKEWQEVAPNKYIRYEQFGGSDEEMSFIVNLFTAELTEPYSSFTYQYFVFGWPDLCITAFGVESETKPDKTVVGDKVGAIVSRVTRKGPGMPLRGYVAMFAVVPSFRGYRLGSRLVSRTVELMRAKDCDEVYLETPTSNARALSLYLNLGFAKTKFLPRYYLDHSDAVRLKLWLKDAVPKPSPETAAVEGKADS